MFSIFKKDPVKDLTKKYHQALEQAMHAQRNGDIRLYASITADAEALQKEIDALKKNHSS